VETDRNSGRREGSHAGNDSRSGPDGSSSHCTHDAIDPAMMNARPRAPISATARNVRGIVSSLPPAIVMVVAIVRGTTVAADELAVVHSDVGEGGITAKSGAS